MTFSFDKSYWSAGPRDEPGYCSQQTLFDDLGKELLDHGFAGFNACILACEFGIRITSFLFDTTAKMGKPVRPIYPFFWLHTDLRNRIWKIVQVCVNLIYLAARHSLLTLHYPILLGSLVLYFPPDAV